MTYQLTPHFSSSEMRCPCCNHQVMDVEFMLVLEHTRKMFKRPMKVNSGYRCPIYNASLKGASKHSQHMAGKAADISCSSPRDKYELIRCALAAGITGIGIYDSFVHLDTRADTPVLWLG